MPEKMKLELFPTATVTGLGGSVSLPAEMVTPGIAIVPCLDLDEGEYRLGGGFNLTHVPSGRTFAAGQACIDCCRHIGGLLAATGVSWPDADTNSAEGLKTSVGVHYDAMIAALLLFRQCQQQMCFHDGPCDICGLTWSHAPYCMHVVGPKVAAANAAALARHP